MEPIIEFLSNNPLYAGGILLLLLLLLFALLKKMFRLALLALLLCVGYLYYVDNLAGKVETKLDAATDKADQLIERADKLINN